MVGCVALRYASGISEELDFGEPGANETYFEMLNITRAYDDCSGRVCDFGSGGNQQVSVSR